MTTTGLDWYYEVQGKKPPTGSSYQVSPGDNWFTISQKVFGTQANAANIVQANPGVYSLKPGMRLNVPSNKKKDGPVAPAPPMGSGVSPFASNFAAGAAGGPANQTSSGLTTGTFWTTPQSQPGQTGAAAPTQTMSTPSTPPMGGGPIVNTVPPPTLGTGALWKVATTGQPPDYMQPWEQSVLGLSDKQMFAMGYKPVQNPGGGSQVLWMKGDEAPKGYGGRAGGGGGGGGSRGGGGGGSRSNGYGGSTFGNYGNYNPAMVGLTSWRI